MMTDFEPLKRQITLQRKPKIVAKRKEKLRKEYCAEERSRIRKRIKKANEKKKEKIKRKRRGRRRRNKSNRTTICPLGIYFVGICH